MRHAGSPGSPPLPKIIEETASDLPKASAAHFWKDWRSGLVGEPTQIIWSSFCSQLGIGRASHSVHGGRSAYGSPQYV